MRHLTTLVAAAVSVLSTATAYADPGGPLAELLADDGGAEDRFGWSVAISGATAIVGAWDDESGDNAGAAYLFDTTTGKQIAKLLPNDGETKDLFGYSVAISGAPAIVGPTDLAIILGNWGPVPPNDPIADIDDDGVVGPADLAIVLGNWGHCG